MSTCPHLIDLTKLEPPRLSRQVHREECTQCFDNQDQPQGVDVCLSCFTGGCLDRDRSHMRLHVAKTGHTFTLNVKRKAKPSPRVYPDSPPPAKMTKLAVLEEREEDKWEHITVLKCWRCDPSNGLELPELAGTDAETEIGKKAKLLVDGVMHSLSSARQSEVKAWEEEIESCEHTLLLQPEPMGFVEASGQAHCANCDLKENLWLCLTCGALGCGRAQFGGVGGNGHALNHYEATKHPVAVKLGTITPEGGADIYCYACNDARLDPELPHHLAAFGINVLTQKKTEKSMTELQIEHNLQFDFSLTDESGNALEPVFGPGLTGLANLGNSCYMASVIQTIFSLPSFQTRYSNNAQHHWQTCTQRLPAECLECQLYKLADGLLSGRYSHPRPAGSSSPGSEPTTTTNSDSPTPTPVLFQEGVKPMMFKALIGRGHEEFSTMRQQDSEEFFTYFVTSLRRQLKKDGREGREEMEDPTRVFRFGVEQRLECGECGGVRYRVDGGDVVSVPVPRRGKLNGQEGEFEDVGLDECLGELMGVEALEYACPSCGKKVIATKQTRMATFPEVLVVHARKFQLVNWVPTKLDIPVILPEDDTLELDKYLGRGVQPGEVELPDDQPAQPTIVFNAEALAQLEGMGFPTVRCHKALLATGNSDTNAAMEWLFQHMDDPDIDAPVQLPGSSPGPEASPETIGMLTDMGFTTAQVKKALRETGGDPDRAVDWLFNHPDETGVSGGGEEEALPATPGVGGSPALPARFRLKAFISHKGHTVHSGHYVAHVRVGGDWVLFNDEKVVRADDESVRQLKKLAYLYVFERV
ncbi:ubiquitin carboxyl-terminal hydrolase 14 [Irpex rosettiformis]|uniref:Ubiquitin carboxyl-terminal hydrolase 14 n=1 Tax=Irpex rosettiformis TaxID=378272 RepID=A0ACB8U6G6_9APHY|nr:ubiquitin carboxyl-terminal hydrolase 14 [Irpex rosettiformis]